MRLECIKYEWSSLTEPGEMNFFGTNPSTVATIDLYNYLIRNSLSDVEYTFENRDNQNILYIEASSLRMQCKNLTYGQTTELQDFFELYSNSNLHKWKLNYYDDDNELIYSGIIYKDSVKYDNRKSTLLSILTIGYEREFKEYFQNKPLVSMLGYEVPPSTLDFNPEGLSFYNLFSNTGIIQRNFSNVTILESLGTVNYHYLEWGYTYAPSNKMVDMSVFHAKCGYRNFADNNVNRFDFFNSLMQCMGWVWYFYLGKLYIKKRNQLNLNTTTLSAGRFISHSVESTLQGKSDIIIIPDGEYYDSGSIGQLAGKRVMFFSDKYEYSNYQRPMRTISYNGSRYNNEYSNWSSNKVFEENEFGLEMMDIDFGSSPDPTSYPVDYTRRKYKNFTYTKLNPIINSYDYTNGLDYHNPREHEGGRFGNGNFIRVANTVQSQAHMLYNGNPANGVLIRDGALYRNYESYCNTSEFKNNFKPLLRNSASVNLKISVKELITNPFQNFMIGDYSYSNQVENKIFFLNKLGFNAQKRISNLELYTI